MGRGRIDNIRHCGMPSGIGSRLGRNRLWVRFPAVSDIYPMFIEPTITWVPSGVLWVRMAWRKIVLNCTTPKGWILRVSLVQWSKPHIFSKAPYSGFEPGQPDSEIRIRWPLDYHCFEAGNALVCFYHLKERISAIPLLIQSWVNVRICFQRTFVIIIHTYLNRIDDSRIGVSNLAKLVLNANDEANLCIQQKCYRSDRVDLNREVSKDGAILDI